jgi:hypothetical protein
MSNIRVANTLTPECPHATRVAQVPPPFVLPQAPAGGKPAGTADARIARLPARSDDKSDAAQAASSRWCVADCEDGPDRSAEQQADANDRTLTVSERTTPQDQPEENRIAPPLAAADASVSVAGSLAAAEDFSLSEELAQMTDSGIFEVLLPDGESLGVAVDVRAAGIGFLLSPSGDKLRTRLEMQKMELEGVLKQRMGRSVKIAIL